MLALQPASGQTYAIDSAIVAKLLAANGIDSLSVEYLTERSNGRITQINLDCRYLDSLVIIPEVSGLTALRSLILSHNRLPILPAQIGQFSRLDTLNLSVCGISGLPPEIANLTGLRVLDMSYSCITSLPAEIGNLTSLTYLDLSNAGMDSLPATIGNLVNLKTLVLSNNWLSSLPASITNLKPVEKLAVDGNRLVSVPDSIRLWLNNYDPGWASVQQSPDLTDDSPQDCGHGVVLALIPAFAVRSFRRKRLGR
jgi:Leucine-rich repeat (LRR) protein